MRLLFLVFFIAFLPLGGTCLESLDSKFILATTIVKPDFGGSGTGFFVSNEKKLLLVTANHVLSKIVNKEILPQTIKEITTTCAVKIPSGEVREHTVHYQSTIDFIPVIRDATHDLAIIDLGVRKEGNDFFALSIDDIASRKDFKEYYVQEGEEVFILGHPYGKQFPGCVGPLIRRCSIAISPMYTLEEAPLFWIDGTVWPGNSGGPVVTAIRQSSPDRGTTRKGAALIGVIRQYEREVDLSYGRLYEKSYHNGVIDSVTSYIKVAADESLHIAGAIPSFYLLDLLEKEGYITNEQNPKN